MQIILKNELILLDLEAVDKEAVLQYMADNLCQLGFVKESYAAAVIEREKRFATGLPSLNGGVAIPHTDVKHVNKAAISVARLKHKTDFVIMGDDSETVAVEIVFMLAMKEEHAQLTLLQNLMAFLQDESAMEFIKTSDSLDDIRTMISQKLGM